MTTSSDNALDTWSGVADTGPFPGGVLPRLVSAGSAPPVFSRGDFVCALAYALDDGVHRHKDQTIRIEIQGTGKPPALRFLVIHARSSMRVLGRLAAPQGRSEGITLAVRPTTAQTGHLGNDG